MFRAAFLASFRIGEHFPARLIRRSRIQRSLSIRQKPPIVVQQRQCSSSSASSESERKRHEWLNLGNIGLIAISATFILFFAFKMSLSKAKKLKTSHDGKTLYADISDYRRRTTSFADPSMGEYQIQLNEACCKIINTPQFNRLHNILQTGACYMVYPSAKHARFEHSLGTCYLAGKLVKNLREKQPHLGITERDHLAVEIAALCHDLGHGPFSHTFDQMFIPSARPDLKEKWLHEDASINMFRHLLDQNPDVKAYLDQILEPEDYIFIAEAIKPVEEKAGWPYKGRPIEKAFLYDIVSNKSHGLDVDKWDYIRRDGVHLSIPTSANLSRLLDNLAVINVNGRPTICYRDKVHSDLANLATTRAQLHGAAYQHRTVKVIEAMIVDALLIADKYLQFPGSDGKMRCLSECIDDMAAYQLTSDSVVDAIRWSTSDELAEARKIIDRVDRRHLYAKVDEVYMSNPALNNKFGNDQRNEIPAMIAKHLPSFKDEYPSIDEERLRKNLVVIISDIHGGMKDHNPIRKVTFYDKCMKLTEIPEEKLKSRAPSPRWKIIRVVCREDNDELIECGRRCFDKWSKNEGLRKDSFSEGSSGGSQPYSSGDD